MLRNWWGPSWSYGLGRPESVSDLSARDKVSRTFAAGLALGVPGGKERFDVPRLGQTPSACPASEDILLVFAN